MSLLKEVVRICAWCNRQIDKDGNAMNGKVSPSYLEWLECSQHTITHGICHICKNRVVEEL